MEHIESSKPKAKVSLHFGGATEALLTNSHIAPRWEGDTPCRQKNCAELISPESSTLAPAAKCDLVKTFPKSAAVDSTTPNSAVGFSRVCIRHFNVRPKNIETQDDMGEVDAKAVRGALRLIL